MKPAALPGPPEKSPPHPDWKRLRRRTFVGMGIFMSLCIAIAFLAIHLASQPHKQFGILPFAVIVILVMVLAYAIAQVLVWKTIIVPIEGEMARLNAVETAFAVSLSEDLFLSRLENMYEGCQIIDRGFRYHFVNDAAAAQYKRSRQELLGKTMVEINPGIEGTSLFEAVRSCMEDGEGKHFDSFLTHPDGTSTWFEFSVQPAPEGIFILSADISERKRADSESLARQAAELANRTKSDFLANMSHELRTPLNSIIGFTEVLQDRLYGELNGKQAEYLGFINVSGRHLLELINEILDLSKIQSGKMEVNLSAFHLRTVLELSVALLRVKAQKKRIVLECVIEAEADVEIVSDERMVKQIMVNLISNAVKFTPDEGSIRVVASLSRDRKDGIGIAVTDTGIGVEEVDFPRLFKEFSQIDSPLQKRFEGTGLGLALSKRFVELLGGSIGMVSEEGKGSTFSIRLPFSTGAGKGRSEGEEEA